MLNEQPADLLALVLSTFSDYRRIRVQQFAYFHENVVGSSASSNYCSYAQKCEFNSASQSAAINILYTVVLSRKFPPFPSKSFS